MRNKCHVRWHNFIFKRMLITGDFGFMYLTNACSRKKVCFFFLKKIGLLLRKIKPFKKSKFSIHTIVISYTYIYSKKIFWGNIPLFLFFKSNNTVSFLFLFPITYKQVRNNMRKTNFIRNPEKGEIRQKNALGKYLKLQIKILILS